MALNKKGVWQSRPLKIEIILTFSEGIQKHVVHTTEITEEGRGQPSMKIALFTPIVDYCLSLLGLESLACVLNPSVCPEQALADNNYGS